MPRLCERPGCSAPAEVAYGFDAEELAVWLDAFDAAQGPRSGGLCRRHANAMVVPLGWMLDDRREPVPRLFSAASMHDLTDEIVRPRPRRSRSDKTRELLRAAAMQLSMEDTGAGSTDVETREVIPPPPVVEVALQPDTASAPEPEPEPEPAPGEPEVEPWRPRFDQQDDLSGLLKARGRLLSRAFSGVTADRA